MSICKQDDHLSGDPILGSFPWFSLNFMGPVFCPVLPPQAVTKGLCPGFADASSVEGSLEVKLPAIWTDEKQRWEESERREE